MVYFFDQSVSRNYDFMRAKRNDNAIMHNMIPIIIRLGAIIMCPW